MYRVRRLDLAPDPPRSQRTAIDARAHTDKYAAWMDYLITCQHAAAELETWDIGSIGVDLHHDNELIEQTPSSRKSEAACHTANIQSRPGFVLGRKGLLVVATTSRQVIRYERRP